MACLQSLKLGVGALAFEPKFVGETQDFLPECFALQRESRQTLAIGLTNELFIDFFKL